MAVRKTEDPYEVTVFTVCYISGINKRDAVKIIDMVGRELLINSDDPMQVIDSYFLNVIYSEQFRVFQKIDDRLLAISEQLNLSVNALNRLCIKKYTDNRKRMLYKSISVTKKCDKLLKVMDVDRETGLRILNRCVDQITLYECSFNVIAEQLCSLFFRDINIACGLGLLNYETAEKVRRNLANYIDYDLGFRTVGGVHTRKSWTRIEKNSPLHRG